MVQQWEPCLPIRALSSSFVDLHVHVRAQPVDPLQLLLQISCWSEDLCISGCYGPTPAPSSGRYPDRGRTSFPRNAVFWPGNIGQLANMVTIPYATAVGLGMATHLAFQTFDPDFYLQPLLLIYFGGWSVLVWVFKDVTTSILSAMLQACMFYSVFTLSFTASLAVYRLFLHRIRSFPGPWQARLSRLYVVARTWQSLQLHVELERLHQIYGDFVRTGVYP